ncbi:MAG: hypothetical protein DMF88_02895 [Acidobacteria bacterium]|nr:MAG: hypothetical protein DMF88_02895 [Acidobacteriota bacterium]
MTMRMLLVTPFLPHRNVGHGTATVVSRFVQYFAARHELSIVTFYNGLEELALVDEVRQQGASVTALPFPGAGFWYRQRTRINTAFDRRPFMVSLFDVPPMRSAIRQLLRTSTFDLVHIDTTQMGSYVDLVGRGGPKTALVEIDVSMKPLRRRYEQAASWPERVVYGREWRRMCRYEPELCRKFDMVFAVSDEDRQLLATAGVADRLALFRYGVDEDVFEIPPKRQFDSALLFLGSFMHEPNVDAAEWFVTSVLPLVRARVPGATVHLVGGWQEKVAHLGRHPGVVVTGRVDDVKRYLAMADVCVVPLRWGGGVKLKTLEMMAAARPVVATHVGTEGIHVEHGTDVLLASSAEEFAARTVELLRDRGAREALGQNARRLVMREHRWQDNLERMERSYEMLVNAHVTTLRRST